MKEKLTSQEEIKMQIQTIKTEVKHSSLLTRGCMSHRDLSHPDVAKCPECKDVLLLAQKVNHLSNILEEANRVNQTKLDLLEQKDSYIIKLKSDIEQAELLYKPTDFTTEEDKLEFLMKDQIEASLVPITKIETGSYLFGTRKMYVKILEDELVVRVGGG